MNEQSTKPACGFDYDCRADVLWLVRMGKFACLDVFTLTCLFGFTNVRRVPFVDCHGKKLLLLVSLFHSSLMLLIRDNESAITLGEIPVTKKLSYSRTLLTLPVTTFLSSVTHVIQLDLVLLKTGRDAPGLPESSI